MIERCPECKQVVEAGPVRICGKCLQPIALHDKWYYVKTGRTWRAEHRHCDNPQSYVPRKVAA